VFAAGIVLMAGLQHRFRPLAPEGTFQEHSSEDMMQTLSLLDLREHPFESLLVLHIQPPLLDAVRAALARLWPEAPPRPLVRRVDRALYVVWTVVYATIGALVYLWLERLTARAVPGGAAAAWPSRFARQHGLLRPVANACCGSSFGLVSCPPACQAAGADEEPIAEFPVW
jgi:hypothetical protein